jgi:hypothetical protein
MNRMIHGSTVLRIVFLLYFVLASASARIAEAGDEFLVYEEDQFEMNFNFGDSCDRLDFLSDEMLRDLLEVENKDNWQQFCFANEYIDCDEYSELLNEFGFLSEDPESDFCSFIPNLKIYEWIPDHFEFYGHLFIKLDFGGV